MLVRVWHRTTVKWSFFFTASENCEHACMLHPRWWFWRLWHDMRDRYAPSLKKGGDCTWYALQLSCLGSVRETNRSCRKSPSCEIFEWCMDRLIDDVRTCVLIMKLKIYVHVCACSCALIVALGRRLIDRSIEWLILIHSFAYFTFFPYAASYIERTYVRTYGVINWINSSFSS